MLLLLVSVVWAGTGVGVLRGWVVADREGLELSRAIRWQWARRLFTGIEGCAVSVVWLRWGSRDFVLVAILVDVVRNWHDLNRLLLCCRHIKRLSVEFSWIVVVRRGWRGSRVAMIGLGCGWRLSWVLVDEARIARVGSGRLGLSRLLGRWDVVESMVTGMGHFETWCWLLDDLHDWDGVRHGHGLLHCDGFCDFDDLWSVLLTRQIAEVDELLARFFQICIVSADGEIKVRLGSILVDAVDLLLDVLLLLMIEVIELRLQLFGLLIEFVEVKWSRRRLRAMEMLMLLRFLWTRRWVVMMLLDLVVRWSGELLLVLLTWNRLKRTASHN